METVLGTHIAPVDINQMYPFLLLYTEKVPLFKDASNRSPFVLQI